MVRDRGGQLAVRPPVSFAATAVPPPLPEVTQRSRWPGAVALMVNGSIHSGFA
jgi:hypothetical protein